MNRDFKVIYEQRSGEAYVGGESYTFVSYETLDNIFPLMSKEISPHERMALSLSQKLNEHPDIWKELADL